MRSSTFFFLFFLFLLFVSIGMAWILKLSGLTLTNKTIKWLACPCQEDVWYSRSFMREEMQEFALNVLHELSKKMARNNTCHANQIYASFIWPSMLAIFFDLTSFFDLQEWVPTRDKKKKKKVCLYVRQRDRKELNCMKSRKREKKKKQGTRLYEAQVL